MPKPGVFISYARSSVVSVERIAALKPALENAGFAVLHDVGITPGDDWENTLEKWLSTCHGAVVFVSPEALSSEWVAREVATLFKRRQGLGSERMRIIPIAIGELDWNDLVKKLADHLFAPLLAVQGGTNLEPDQVLAALRGLHDFVGLPVGLDRGSTSAPPTVLNVLRASQEIVSFQHRTAEMDTLAEWIGHDRRCAVLLIHGPAGVGKTRLALELIRRQNHAGWDAGFLRRDASEVMPLIRGTDPLLVAIDYAETRTQQVRDLLRTLATYAKTDARPNVRVILLARTPADWWTHLSTDDSEVEFLVDQGPRQLALQPLAVAQRAKTWDEAAHRFAEVLGRPLRGAADQEQSLLSELPGLPLYIHMAALDYILRTDNSKPFRSSDDLLDRILSHERRYWGAWVTSHNVAVDEVVREVLDRTAAAIVLLGGVAAPGLLRTIVEGQDAQFEWRREYWDALRYLYPDGHGGIRPLEPNLLGEHLANRVLSRTDGDMLSSIADQAPAAGSSSLFVLTRLGSRTGDAHWLRKFLQGRLGTLAEAALSVASSEGEPLGETLASLFDEDTSETLANRIHDLMPPAGRTMVLRRLAVGVARRRLGQAPSDDSVSSRLNRAQAHEELAKRLGEVGELEDAQPAIFAAILLFGSLLNDSGESFGAPLAKAMGVQADLLDQTGKVQNAIESGQAAITLMKLLKPEYREVIEPLLGTRYNNLATAYAKLGQYGQAAESAQQAVEYYRHLALKGAYQAECAIAFGNLGRYFVKLGNADGGITCLRVSTTMLRALAAKHPDAFELQLASALDALGTALRDFGSITEAIDVLREAVHVLRSLHRRAPDGNPLQLAAVLIDLGALLNGSGSDHADAVALGREAVALLSKLAEQGDSGARAEQSRALHELGRFLANSGERNAALETAQQAVTVRQTLFAEGALDHERLALSQGSLGKMYLDFGDPENGANVFRTAVEGVLAIAGPLPASLQSILTNLADSYVFAETVADGDVDEQMLRRVRDALDNQGSSPSNAPI
jgi:tetratricopeptide (TPR) repeat protein